MTESQKLGNCFFDTCNDFSLIFTNFNFDLFTKEKVVDEKKSLYCKSKSNYCRIKCCIIQNKHCVTATHTLMYYHAVISNTAVINNISNTGPKCTEGVLLNVTSW